jgi:hypothetical protein
MCDAGKQDVVQVPQHRSKRLADLGWRLGQRAPDLTRLDLREHRQLAHSLEV